uniref:Uncharacterized protein n=1 Tax=Anguilla anguilla TaxID=7936 RepID=A0A0E9RWK2_ANGAN
MRHTDTASGVLTVKVTEYDVCGFR